MGNSAINNEQKKDPFFEICYDDQDNQQKDQYLDIKAKDLRNQASQFAQKRNQAFQLSQDNWKNGNKADAKKFSDEGKQYENLMIQYNKMACNHIVQINNVRNPFEVLDLHGLYVSEAVEATEQKIIQARQKNVKNIKIIVGKGTHSKNGVQKIKPAIQKLISNYNLQCYQDTKNQGIILLEIDSQNKGFINTCLIF